MKSGKRRLRAGSTNIQLSGNLFYLMCCLQCGYICKFYSNVDLYSFPVYLFRGNPILFFVFHYTQVENDLGLGGFLSFLVATAAAQTVNFYVQKNFVFRSNAAAAALVLKGSVVLFGDIYV